MKAKCVMFHEFGDPQTVLKIKERAVPRPLAGEVVVRMKARPINPSDLIPIRGAYANRIMLPGIPGYEGVGIVVDARDSDSRKLIGKRVMPLRGEGTWQEFVKSPAELAVPIPDHLDDFTAAQLYINPVTAWVVCTEVLKLRTGDVLLVNAGGSSIAWLFAQFSQIIGFKMIAITRNDRYSEELLRLGVSGVVDTSKSTLKGKVIELTDRIGATAAIDSVGGADGTELAFCVQPGGNFVTIGLLSGEQVDWKAISERVHVRLFHLRHWNAKVSTQKWQETFRHLIGLVLDHQVTLMPKAAEYNLSQVKDAIGLVKSPNRNNGKIFLTG